MEFDRNYGIYLLINLKIAKHLNSMPAYPTGEYLNQLTSEFEQNASTRIAEQQQAYMKNQFAFYGITAPARREIQKPFLVKQYLPPKEHLEELTTRLWEMPQREYQMFAQELVRKYVRQFEPGDISLLEYMVMNKSWWDTVDYISAHLIGGYFMQYPDQRGRYVEKWLGSGHLWLQRSALLFQLNYKKDLDTELLSHTIVRLLGSKEFFINKAIGWILRQYGKTNPEWVLAFVRETQLANLSRKEALRLIQR